MWMGSWAALFLGISGVLQFRENKEASIKVIHSKNTKMRALWITPQVYVTRSGNASLK
jgi:hypothetical protein